MVDLQHFETALSGGHPNSLGNTVPVVDEVLKNPTRFSELFACYESKDPVVRLRVSNAMKRVAAGNRVLLMPYIDKLIQEVATLNQASAQ
jgi:hypothetical protein